MSRVVLYLRVTSRAPLFSIVLPTRNRADVLPFAIRSALWQTVDDFELLIAGDGCTDHTADVVATIDDPRIRWFDLPKAPGFGYANRNIVLREARGRYIAYLAHDDMWFPDHLERLGALLDETGAEFAYSRGLAVGLDGRITPYWYNLGVPGHQAGLWRGESAIAMCQVVHDRSCLTKYGCWDESLLRSADVAMWHRIVAGGRFRNLTFLSDPTTLHFVANWRNTGRNRARTRLAGFLAGDFHEGLPAGALRLPVHATGTQQASAWNYLVVDPNARIREIRKAVVLYQDALLWRSRTLAGLVGIRVGLSLGTVLVRLSKGLMWIASKERRQMLRRLRKVTWQVEKTLR